MYLKIIFITGIINVVSIVLLFFSCRCIGGKFALLAMRHRWFQWLYKYHCWYWWLFFGSVIVHSILAFYLFGFPW